MDSPFNHTILHDNTVSSIKYYYHSNDYEREINYNNIYLHLCCVFFLPVLDEFITNLLRN